MESEKPMQSGRNVLWTGLTSGFAVTALMILLTIKHPRTDQWTIFHTAINRLFLANVILAVVLVSNSIRYLIFLKWRIFGMVLALLTGLQVFFLVEWFLKLQSAH